MTPAQPPAPAGSSALEQAELIASLAHASDGVVRTSTYDFDVERYDDLKHYSALINGYEIGKVDYVERENRLVLTSVAVVSSFRRQGIATEFIARVLDDIRERGDTATVECPVIAAFVQRFPEYGDVIDGESATGPSPGTGYAGDREEGLYVDRVSGEPLFASIHAFDSGSGWPGFTASIAPENLALRYESIFSAHRTEVRSRQGDSHLGYVYTDGTPEDGCLRYVVDPTAVRLIPVGELDAHGYSSYRAAFAAAEPIEEH